MDAAMASNRHAPLSRSETGKWLGGVCAGLARGREVDLIWIRAAFLLGALIGGLGVFVYLACWLIIPLEGERPDDPSSGWLVVLARVLGASAGVLTLAALGAVVTLFGFGWAVLALAAAVLLAVLLAWPRLGPGWALLPVAALALPSVAVAAAGLRLEPATGNTLVAPHVLSSRAGATYRAGLGTMLVDLRRTDLPASGVVPLRIEGGVRRTIVALPADRCVRVELSYDVQPLVANLAAQLSTQQPDSGVVIFGDQMYTPSGQVAAPDTGLTPSQPRPVLRIDFTSTGGSLYLRDYPDSVDPELSPNWPGYRVYPEPHPNTNGESKRAASRTVRAWRVRRAAQVRSQRLIDSLMPGPCASEGKRR
jgi:phage shock protein PspC (stress-responsive transcriptional regulator)